MKTDELKRISIEISSYCNYACAGCPTKNLLRGKGNIARDIFSKILQECGNKVEKIFLWGYGEPLLHPEISELLNITGAYRCKKILSTNGSKLEDFEDLEFLSNLDELIISINGFDDESYKKHQIGGDFLKVKRGIRKAFNILKKYKTRKILQVVAHKHNINDLDKARDFSTEMGFDEVVVKSFNVMDKNEKTFEDYVPKGTKYSRYGNNFEEGIPTPSISGVYPCERWIVINWDGSVNTCCWDYFGEFSLGNVMDGGVYQVWDSPKAKEHRENIRKRKFKNFCIDCANTKTILQYNVKSEDKSHGTSSI